MYRRKFLIPTIILGLAAAGGGFAFWGAQPVNTDCRVPEAVAVSGDRATAFMVEPDGSGPKQQDIREIGLAFGRGALHYPEAPTEMVILGGRAYLQEPGGAGIRTADVLVNTEYALGLGRDAAASVLYLPDGSPVTLAALLADIGTGLDGQAVVLGVGRFSAVLTEPEARAPAKNRFSAWWTEWFEKAPASTGLAFAAFREAGPGGGSWRLRGVLTGSFPDTGPVGTPEEVFSRIKAAGLESLTPLSAHSTAVELNLAVYHLAEIVPAADFIEPPLVEIGALDPSIVLDIRYAGTDNFVGRPVYAASRAYLVLPEAERLVRVNIRLREQGFKLKVFDGYRPFSDHARLWELAPDKSFWADPENGSRHSRGAAVDCTLVTLDGQDVEMPTGFDDFTHRAHRSYQGASDAALRHRAVLEAAMVAEGFVPLEKEWWHFDSPVWWEYPLLDIPLG